MALTSSSSQLNTSFTFTTPIKLDRTNYTIWKQQVLSSIRGNGLESYIDGSKICPTQYLFSESRIASSSNTEAQAQENPEYGAWKRQDQLLLSWIMSSISVDILSLVVNSQTSFELWKSLEKQFGFESMAKKVHLKMLLNNLRKGSLSMTEYFTKLKTVTDGLALAGSPVSDINFITHLITGLDHSYYPVVVYVEANMLNMDLSEAYSMLLTHEARLKNNKHSENKEMKSNYAANIAQSGNFQKKGGSFNNSQGNWHSNNSQGNWNQGRGNNWNFNGGRSGFTGNGRGNNQGQGRGNNWNGNFRGNSGGFNNGYRRCGFGPGGYGRGQQQGPRAAYMAISEGVADQGWYLGSGATHHLTNSVQHLNDGKLYSGSNSLLIGNGQGLQITHIGYTCFYTSCGSYLHLQDILCVPKITKNLISVSKLLANNNITIEFISDACFVKDKVKGTLLAQGIAKGGLNKLLSCEDSVLSSNVSTLKMFSSSSFSQSSVDRSVFASPLCTLHDNSSYQSPAASPCSAVLPTPGSSVSSQHHEPSSPSTSVPHQTPHILHLPQPPINQHSMITRAKSGIFKLKTFLTVTQSYEPKSVKEALADLKWHMAMKEEFTALEKNQTWTLVLADTATKIVGNKWVFRVKYNPDGSVSKFKVRLVAKGFHQTYDIDFFETFSPVVKPCTLNKALYGLKQGPRAWYDRLSNSLLQWGFQALKSDTSLFFQHNERDIVMVLIYVDDILVTGSNTVFIEKIIEQFGSEFALKDLGDFSYFLGLEVTPSAEGLHLSQTKYICDILSKTNMLGSKSCNTPISVSEKLKKDLCNPFENPPLYRSVIGSLQYITLTRPEIAFTVSKLSQFLAAPTVLHWQSCKRLLRYLQGTAHFGLQFHHSGSLNLTAYSDADWGSDPDDRRSMGGYCMFLGSNLVSWSSKKQTLISRFTAESEYRALASATSEVLWRTYLLRELKVQLDTSPLLHCDNKSVEALASNPKYHTRTKHIELDLHFIREHVAKKEFTIQHVSSSDQLADIFTKPWSFDHFAYMRSKLNVSPRP
ncbi:retrovirus-related pol polyprotein from transposon RE2 [Citrus sinensis]|uniref:Retrovirus-related pol polyprotein from transposon RE2 n=1 Tax=Citrus sinensis TaxID=2711 RepID=A0ACB8MUA7_CITSI|nr:retrovirus-related pol polyprotein from transposon RE2 [Citrus sinensis]KAH9789249.1 retrovirus-related pol polyprotein from transposon RE2 [Citrus sinensis]